MNIIDAMKAAKGGKRVRPVGANGWYVIYHADSSALSTVHFFPGVTEGPIHIGRHTEIKAYFPVWSEIVETKWEVVPE